LLERKYKNELDEDASEYLNFIIDGTNKMNDLIEDLLEYSRIRHKQLSIEIVDMNELVEDLFTEQSMPLTKKPILHKSLLPKVKGDIILLKQVWANLLSNAIKYSSKSTPSEIFIGANKNRREITYWIRDNGIGFDMELASRLFSLFSRLHSDKEYSGTGVGLSLVYKIVKKHGGKIWAESIPNEGSTFYFTLPVK
jgi:light-regulated signal transduction histidine kinase (bacteriophytochrome)